MSIAAPRWARRLIAPLCAFALVTAPAVAVASTADQTTTEQTTTDGATTTADTAGEVDAPRDQAVRVTVGSHTGVADAIDPAGEQDWFFFEAPRAGAYVVEVFDTASTLSPVLYGYSGDTRVATGADGDGSVAKRMVMNVSITGTYHVRVSGNFSTQRGTYRVRVLPQYDQGLTWMSNGEPDGHLLLAPAVGTGRTNAVSRAIEPGRSGILQVRADVDWIRFTAPRAGTYTIEVFDAAAEMYTQGYDAAGNRMRTGTAGAGAVDHFVELPVSIPGDYFVRATTNFSSASGTYQVRVLPQYDQGLTWTSAQEPNNTRMTGFPLARAQRLPSVNEPRRAGSRDRADVDWFNVEVRPGVEHIVDVVPNGYTAYVQLFDQAGTRLVSRTCSSGSTCTLATTPSLAGRYHVRVSPNFSSESGTYTVCARAAGETCTAGPAKVTRLGGKDRYATAARVAGQFSPNIDVAFVADGNNFPDALAGAARAGSMNAPVLLTRASSLPGATTAELTRLRPNRIVVLGGPSAVNDTVLRELRQYTRSTGADAVTRIAGKDRFDTSARISGLYPSGVATAYVATGRAFPDALSGAALAGTQDSPLLLVDTQRIPTSVQAELTRLRPQRIVILGGSGAVSGEVATALAQYATAGTSKVTRISGSDRYVTSAAVAARFPTGVQGAYVATGRSFPDALAGAALAGTRHSPVLLSGPTNLSSALTPQLERLRPGHGYLIGSASVLSDEVARQLSAYIR